MAAGSARRGRERECERKHRDSASQLQAVEVRVVPRPLRRDALGSVVSEHCLQIRSHGYVKSIIIFIEREAYPEEIQSLFVQHRHVVPEVLSRPVGERRFVVWQLANTRPVILIRRPKNPDNRSISPGLIALIHNQQLT